MERFSISVILMKAKGFIMAKITVSISILFMSAVAVASGSFALGAALGLGSKDKKKTREPFCFLYGDAIQSTEESKGPDTIANMIRLRFAASNSSECMQVIEEYCRKEILGKGHSVGKLKGFFQDDSQNRTDFSVLPACAANRIPVQGEKRSDGEISPP